MSTEAPVILEKTGMSTLLRFLRFTSLILFLTFLVALQGEWDDLTGASIESDGGIWQALPPFQRWFFSFDALHNSRVPPGAVVSLCVPYLFGILFSSLARPTPQSCLIVLETQVIMLSFTFAWNSSLDRIGANRMFGNVDSVSDWGPFAVIVCLLTYIICEVIFYRRNRSSA